MLESVSDYIATGVLIVLLIGTLAFVLRMFLHHRTKRLIEEEIEYYQEWEKEDIDVYQSDSFE